MYPQIAEYKNAAYETHKNGLFWQTYIYKKDADLNFRLIDIARSLIEPEVEVIQEIIDNTIATASQRFHDPDILKLYAAGDLT
nr:hypothetical protein [uncultured Methanolobus sp.]